MGERVSSEGLHPATVARSFAWISDAADLFAGGRAVQPGVVEYPARLSGAVESVDDPAVDTPRLCDLGCL